VDCYYTPPKTRASQPAKPAKHHFVAMNDTSFPLRKSDETSVSSSQERQQSAQRRRRRRQRQYRKDDTSFLLVDLLLDYVRDHRLPRVAETIVAWLVAASCLLYYGSIYVMSTYWRLPTGKKRFLPLMTDNAAWEGCEDGSADLRLVVDRIRQQIASTSNTNNSTKLMDSLVAAIRTNASLRQQVSLFMKQPHAMTEYPDLYQQFDAIWLDLLRLPDVVPPPSQQSTSTTNTNTTLVVLSLILPAYKEKGTNVAATLHHARLMCHDPKAVQVVVVDAGQCTDLTAAALGTTTTTTTTTTRCTSTLNDDDSDSGDEWGQLQVIHYDKGGGRGPCLNAGAAVATGSFLVFLHADTLLPRDWDRRVVQTLSSSSISSSAPNNNNLNPVVAIHACAFHFGHDTSIRGLNGMPYPWGIRAVWILGNIRASWFQLPYGDHVICMPAAYFHHIGGYPDQSIMEDYELMDLLRKRAAVLPERLRIVPGPGTKCSVRRWQQFGTAYVTLVNAVLVYRYIKCGWTAEDVHDYYYRRPLRNAKKIV
jgi:glycosyltransferase involved in cell wall biosynthesis